jgi:hypothetical protein
MNHPHSVRCLHFFRLTPKFALLNLGMLIDMSVSELGIDIAKNTCQLRAVAAVVVL